MSNVVLVPKVMQGIVSEVRTPGCAGETGGILLGSRSLEEVRVLDFEPVLCGRRHGSSYLLDEEDWRALQESLDWFHERRDPGLAVLGFYRSTSAPEFVMDSQDREWLARHAPEDGSIFLLLRPIGGDRMEAQLFSLRGGDLVGGPILPFPFEDAMTAPERPPEPTPEPPPDPIEPVVPVDPTPMPQDPNPGPKSTTLGRTTAIWVAVLLALTIGGAGLGYRSGIHNRFDRAVRASIEQWAGPSHNVRISDLRITPVSPDRAIATFRREWRSLGRSPREEHDRVVLDRAAGSWKIASAEPISR